MTEVVIVSAVYPPEPMVSAQIGHDLAGYLAERGISVTVLCPHPSRPIGTDYSKLLPSGAAKILQEGKVKVVRLPSFTAPQSSLAARMRESFSFGRQVCRYLDQCGECVDVIYANTWPFFSQWLLARYSQKRDIPLVLHIQDVYPESLLAKLPSILSRCLRRPLQWVDQCIARRASALVVISQSMRQLYIEDRRIPEPKIYLCPNWQNEAVFEAVQNRTEACLRYGVEASLLTFLYLGNIGQVSGIDILIQAFHRAQLKNAQLLLIGDGSAKQSCIDLSERLDCKNIRFVSDPHLGNVPLLQSMADVCLLPLRRGAGSSSIPSKLPAYMFSAKPVLATVDSDSDSARCVRDAHCGWIGEPEDIAWLADKLKEVATLPQRELQELGRAGLRYGLEHFSRSEGVPRLASVVLKYQKRPEDVA